MYFCITLSCTRQIESKLSLRSLAKCLHKIGCGSAIEASFIALALHNLCITLSCTRHFIYLMLPLFKKEEEECENDFERWIYVLNNMNTFDRMPFLAKNAVFKKLAEIADVNTLTQAEKEKYDESLKIMRDAYATYKTAKNIGREEGVKEGRAQGLKEGIKEGLKEGIKAGRAEECRGMAIKMKQNGLDIMLISQITGLSEEEINQLN